MSDLTKHTLTINISDRIEWIDKRCGLTEIQKDYITAQMKEAVSEAVQQANGANASDSGLHLQNVSRCFSSKEQLQSYITTHIPIAVKPIKPAKTTFVNPFTSNNARQIVEDAIVECLLNNG